MATVQLTDSKKRQYTLTVSPGTRFDELVASLGRRDWVSRIVFQMPPDGTNGVIQLIVNTGVTETKAVRSLQGACKTYGHRAAELIAELSDGPAISPDPIPVGADSSAAGESPDATASGIGGQPPVISGVPRRFWAVSTDPWSITYGVSEPVTPEVSIEFGRLMASRASEITAEWVGDARTLVVSSRTGLIADSQDFIEACLRELGYQRSQSNGNDGLATGYISVPTATSTKGRKLKRGKFWLVTGVPGFLRFLVDGRLVDIDQLTIRQAAAPIPVDFILSPEGIGDIADLPIKLAPKAAQKQIKAVRKALTSLGYEYKGVCHIDTQEVRLASELVAAARTAAPDHHIGVTITPQGKIMVTVAPVSTGLTSY